MSNDAVAHIGAHRVKFSRTAHHRVEQVYLRFAKHALEDPLFTLDRFRRAHFIVEMAFRCLATLSASARFPTGFADEVFSFFVFTRAWRQNFSCEVAPGARAVVRLLRSPSGRTRSESHHHVAHLAPDPEPDSLTAARAVKQAPQSASKLAFNPSIAASFSFKIWRLGDIHSARSECPQVKLDLR